MQGILTRPTRLLIYPSTQTTRISNSIGLVAQYENYTVKTLTFDICHTFLPKRHCQLEKGKYSEYLVVDDTWILNTLNSILDLEVQVSSTLDEKTLQKTIYLRTTQSYIVFTVEDINGVYTGKTFEDINEEEYILFDCTSINPNTNLHNQEHKYLDYYMNHKYPSIDNYMVG